jgi:hypothetical protein
MKHVSHCAPDFPGTDGSAIRYGTQLAPDVQSRGSVPVPSLSSVLVSARANAD